MKDYFSNEKNNKLFYFWLSSFPKSTHTRDEERFYRFIMSLFDTSEELTAEILSSAIKEVKSWNDETVSDFVDTFLIKYIELKRFWEYNRKNSSSI